MDIYDRKSKWKWYLAIVGLLIVGITMFYTSHLVSQLSKGEETQVKLFANTLKEIQQQPLSSEADEDLYLVEDITNLQTRLSLLLEGIPVILVDETGNVNSGMNFGETKDTSIAFLEKELQKMIASGTEPIEGDGYASKIYFKNTRLLTLLQYFPILQFLLISFFIAFGYFTFSSALRAELKVK